MPGPDFGPGTFEILPRTTSKESMMMICQLSGAETEVVPRPPAAALRRHNFNRWTSNAQAVRGGRGQRRESGGAWISLLIADWGTIAGAAFVFAWIVVFGNVAGVAQEFEFDFCFGLPCNVCR